MKAFLVFAVGGPVLLLTNAESILTPSLLKRIKYLGKFISFEAPLDTVKANYAAHLEHVLADPKHTDELRILDTESAQIFTNVELNRLGPAVVYQSE